MSDSVSAFDLPGRLRESLIFRQAVLAATAAMLTAVVAGAGTSWVSRLILRDQVHLRISDAFEERRRGLVALIERDQSTLVELASEPQLGGLLRKHERGVIRREQFRETARLPLVAITSRPDVLGLWISAPDGAVIASAGSARDEDPAAWKSAASAGAMALWLGTEHSGEGHVIELAIPVHDDAGLAIARLHMRSSLAKLDGALRAPTEREMLQDLKLVVEETEGLRVLPEGDDPLPASVATVLDRAARGDIGFFRVGGESPSLVLSRPLASELEILRGWRLVAVASLDRIYEPLRRASRIAGVVVFAVAAIACWAVMLAMRLLARPLSELDRATARLPVGDPSARLPVRSSDEVGRIAAVFNEVIAHSANEHDRTTRHVVERTRELEDQNRRLRVRNEELDQFVYSAAHDLRAPLRAIENLASWVVEDSAASLSDRANEDLMTIRTRARDLKHQLGALLEYSKVGQREERSGDIDTVALVDEIVAALDAPEEVRIGVSRDLPFVFAPEAPLHAVFQNLIDNAIQHRNRGAACEIRVSGLDGGEWVEFSVSDDGPGIAAEDHERIFDLFQSLNPRDDGGASGMGLAIVKKTIEYFGGRIVVESSLQKGATFRFTWPKVAP